MMIDEEEVDEGDGETEMKREIKSKMKKRD
jgi:hypothetical protein